MSDPSFASPSGAAPSPAATLLRLLNAFPESLHLPSDAPQLITRLSELGSGLSLFHFLHALDPGHFDPEPLQQSGDASARAANIQYLLDSLETFFEESMGTNMDLSFLDLAAICSEDDSPEADAQRVQLLELVLLCAINSEHKEQVIEAIMSMSDAEQQTLMTLINQQMEQHGGGGHAAAGINDSRASGGAANFVPFTPSTASPVADGTDASTSAAGVLSTPLRGSAAAGAGQQDHDSSFLSSASSVMDTPASASTVAARAATATAEAATAAAHKKVDALLAEKSQLTKQLDAASRDAREWKRQANEAMEKLATQAETLTAQHKSALAQREQEVERAAQASSKNELARLSKEVARGESRAQDLEQSLRTSQEQLMALQRELAKTQELAEERSADLARLTDDLHLAQSKLADLSGLQSKHDKLRAKLGEMEGLKSTVENLEGENSRQLDRIIELESSSKELDALRLQLNRLRDLNVAADSALLDRTLAEETAKQEILELKEVLQGAREEQRALNGELKAAKQERDDALAKLRMAAQTPGRSSTPLGSGDLHTEDSSTSLASDAATENPRATIRRLEFELAKLRADAAAASSSASAAPSAEAGPTPMELSLLRTQKDALQEKYLESQRRLASLTSELSKARREHEDKVSTLERLLEEEKEKAAQEAQQAEAKVAKANANSGTIPPAALEEIAQLRQEASELHEQLDSLRAAASAASPSSAAAAAATVAESPSKVARPSAASSAVQLQLQTDLDAASLRNKKLEAYIKQSQKKSKVLEEEHARTQMQLQQQHEAYKLARAQLVEREREIVEREKARATENAQAVRERKLMSSAFYSMGMEYHASVEHTQRSSAAQWWNTVQCNNA